MTKQMLGTYAYQGNTYGPGNYQQDTPASRGWKEWNFPIAHMHNGFGPSNGVVYLMKFTAWTGGTATNLLVGQNTKSGTPVTSQCWFGLYDSSGNRLAQTNDMAATLAGGSAPQLISGALQSTYAMVAGTSYWFAILYNQSGGIGQGNLYATSLGNTFSMMNAGLTGYQSKCSSYSSGLTTLPSTITTGSVSASGGIMWWVGVS